MNKEARAKAKAAAEKAARLRSMKDQLASTEAAIRQTEFSLDPVNAAARLHKWEAIIAEAHKMLEAERLEQAGASDRLATLRDKASRLKKAIVYHERAGDIGRYLRLADRLKGVDTDVLRLTGTDETRDPPRSDADTAVPVAD